MTQITIEAAPPINNGYAPDSIFFSPSQLIFCLGRHYDRFGPRWPSDAKQITQEEWVTYTRPAADGKMLGSDSDGNPAWVYKPVLKPSAAQAAKILGSSIDVVLQALTLSWGYTKGIDNATTWSQSSNSQFAAEGKALLDWRDAVWAWAAAQPAGTTSTDGMPAAPDRPTINKTGA